jgi:hypothetical protein
LALKRQLTRRQHAITPSSIRAGPPEDGRVTVETCTDLNTNKTKKLKKLYQIGIWFDLV